MTHYLILKMMSKYEARKIIVSKLSSYFESCNEKRWQKMADSETKKKRFRKGYMHL